MSTGADRPRVSGVLLAAGQSERFQAAVPKQLVDFRGEPLVRRMVRRVASSQLSELVVVTGFQAARVRESLQGLEVRVVENPDYRSGQSCSVRTGLGALSRTCQAALFIPVDQPYLEPDLINRMVESFGRHGHDIIVPVIGRRRASPVLFSRALFPELEQIQGDQGGRQLFERHHSRLVELSVENERSLLDFDTFDQYQRLLGS